MKHLLILFGFMFLVTGQSYANPLNKKLVTKEIAKSSEIDDGVTRIIDHETGTIIYIYTPLNRNQQPIMKIVRPSEQFSYSQGQ